MAHTPIYLDFAAATPMHPDVRAAMEPYFEDFFYNPSATYQAGRKVKQVLEEARASVAYVIGCRPSEVVFTAGGTEANNLAIQGVLEQYPDAEVVVSSVEHDSVLRVAEKYPHKTIEVHKDGLIDLNALANAITDKTVLVSVMYANNEVGTIQPIRRITRMVDEIRKQRRISGNSLPLFVHTDAAQAGNYLDMHVARLGVDLMTINSGKLYGPKQSGVLYVASHVRLGPIIVGGGQERNLRSGTESVAQAVGFATALKRVQSIRRDAALQAVKLQKIFIEQLQQAFPGVIVNGSQKFRLPNNVHITLPGQDNERLLFALDERGIMAAAGSACSASNEEPSHVLRAIGISAADAQSSLRFTLGATTTEQEIHQTVQALVDIAE